MYQLFMIYIIKKSKFIQMEKKIRPVLRVENNQLVLTKEMLKDIDLTEQLKIK